MNTDYKDAHERHLEDADYLYKAGHLANADHLFGMSAECGLKSIMLVGGMPVDSFGSPKNSEDKVHIDNLVKRFNSYMENLPTRNLQIKESDFFKGWHVTQRYAHRQCFNRQSVEKSRNDANKVTEIVKLSINNGTLT